MKSIRRRVQIRQNFLAFEVKKKLDVFFLANIFLKNFSLPYLVSQSSLRSFCIFTGKTSRGVFRFVKTNRFMLRFFWERSTFLGLKKH